MISDTAGLPTSQTVSQPIFSSFGSTVKAHELHLYSLIQSSEHTFRVFLHVQSSSSSKFEFEFEFEFGLSCFAAALRVHADRRERSYRNNRNTH